MKQLADFHSRVMPHLPGCSVPLVNQFIVDAAIQFCEATGAIRQTMDAITLVPDMGVYDFDAPSQQQVVRITRAFLDGREIRLVPLNEAPTPQDRTGEPVFLHTISTDSYPEFVLTPAPDKAYSLVLEVASRPTRTATALADDLLTLWLEAITAGAIGAGQRIPAQPFTDPAGAGQRYAEFRSHISRARINASMGRVQGTQRVRGRPLA